MNDTTKMMIDLGVPVESINKEYIILIVQQGPVTSLKWTFNREDENVPDGLNKVFDFLKLYFDKQEEANEKGFSTFHGFNIINKTRMEELGIESVTPAVQISLSSEVMGMEIKDELLIKSIENYTRIHDE